MVQVEDALEQNDNNLVANRTFLLQSGKLVTKMFQKIQQLIDDKEALVFVLIDEVKTVEKNWLIDRGALFWGPKIH